MGRNDVDNRVMCSAKPQLCVDSRYLEKENSDCCSKFIRNECLVRVVMGYTVLVSV